MMKQDGTVASALRGQALFLGGLHKSDHIISTYWPWCILCNCHYMYSSVESFCCAYAVSNCGWCNFVYIYLSCDDQQYMVLNKEVRNYGQVELPNH